MTEISKIGGMNFVSAEITRDAEGVWWVTVARQSKSEVSSLISGQSAYIMTETASALQLGKEKDGKITLFGNEEKALLSALQELMDRRKM